MRNVLTLYTGHRIHRQPRLWIVERSQTKPRQRRGRIPIRWAFWRPRRSACQTGSRLWECTHAHPSPPPTLQSAHKVRPFLQVSVQPPVVDLVLRIPGYAFVEYSLDGDIVHQEWKNQATLSDGQASVSTLVRQDTSGHFFSVGGK